MAGAPGSRLGPAGGAARAGPARTPLGPLVIARVEGEQQPGADVSLGEDGNVPVAGR